MIRRLRSALVAITATAVMALGMVAIDPAAEPAEAVDMSQFAPGNIVSDEVFYAPGAMTVPQIQGFLDARVPACASGYTCLKSYREVTWSRGADAYCQAYPGGDQSAAEIIWLVAQACGINPQVLIVLLQKEQGLVTKTAPSSGSFLRATGYGCPDTAPCEAAYYGFYNQVYLAARQYQIYRIKPTSFNYRAGRWNTILWHPDGACGTSQVYIENQATAGLYNYTPYRPNQAALDNPYGTGDGCSSYGNRNFFAYFSDWFGDPRGGGWLVRTSDDPTIYLITTTTKHAVNTLALFESLGALGPYRIVGQPYLDGLTTGEPATNFLRDPTTGEIFFVGDGSRNRFSDCDQLETYGSSCARVDGTVPWIDVPPSALTRIPLGPVITPFIHSLDTGQIYYVDVGLKHGVHSFAKIAELAAGGPQTWFSHSQVTIDQIPSGPDFLEPGMTVRTASSSSRYVVDADRLIPVADGVAEELGLSGAAVVSDVSLDVYATAGEPLSLLVSCGAVTYAAGGGSLWPLSASTASAVGVPVTALDAATCAVLRMSGTTVSGGLLYRVPSTGWIYSIVGGQKRFLSTMDAVYAANGSGPLVMVPVSQAAIDTIPTGADVLGVGRLVKSASASTVYLVDGASAKVPITTFAVPAELGVSGYSVVSDVSLDVYATAGEPLSLLVSCGAVTYAAGGGSLWPLSASTASAVGVPVTALDAATCAVLRMSGTTVSGGLLYRVPSTGWIYSIVGGQKRFLSTMDAVYAANGSGPLVMVPVSQAAIDTIPTGG